MRARPLSARAGAALLLIVLLASGCRGRGEIEAATPSPPDPQSPEPVTLVLTDVELASMDNGEILVGTAPAPDEATAEAAVEATRKALERYLNAQFVDPDTRFTQAPARALLHPAVFDSLPPERRAALGVRYQPVAGVVPGPATGKATVLFNRGSAYAVSIDYRFMVELHYPHPESETPGDDIDTSHPLTQQGTVVFTAPSWIVESFDLRTEGPDAGSPPPATGKSATETSAIGTSAAGTSAAETPAGGAAGRAPNGQESP